MYKITGSLEDYLEAIYLLQQKNETVRITDLAAELSISKPSANRAVDTLRKDGLVLHEKYGTITLTTHGEEIAKDVYFRHQSLLRFLVENLGVEPKLAEEDACRMEHVISEETLRRLIAYSQKHSKTEANLEVPSGRP